MTFQRYTKQELERNDYYRSLYNWMDKWLRRNRLRSICLSGEAASADQREYEIWLNNFKQRIKTEKLTPDQIWNADESGIFYKQLPTKTITQKGHFLKGWKKPKNRLSFLNVICMNGRTRKPLIISNLRSIGSLSSRHPERFSYAFQSSSWMETGIFNAYLKEWDKELEATQRDSHIILVVDNCSSHTITDKFKHIEVLTLPANVTSIGQPCDQGVIKNHKCIYRDLLLNLLLDRTKTHKPFRLEINQYVILIVKAWQMVSSTTIINCFRKAGWMDPDPAPSSKETTNNTVNSSNSDPNQVHLQRIRQALDGLALSQVEPIVEFPYEDSFCVESFISTQAKVMRDEVIKHQPIQLKGKEEISSEESPSSPASLRPDLSSLDTKTMSLLKDYAKVIDDSEKQKIFLGCLDDIARGAMLDKQSRLHHPQISEYFPPVNKS